MIKVAISWILIASGSLLSAQAIITAVVYLLRLIRIYFAARSGSITTLLSPPPTVPDASGIYVPWLRFQIMTNPWVLLIGTLGVGLIVLAVGLHLHYLHRLDIVREQIG
jgi:hypothetical protein